MRKLFLLTVFVALATIVFAQESKIENTRLQLEGDKLVITYDLSGAKPLENVWLEIKTTSNKEIFAHTLNGDINKTVFPGKSKQIIWDMKADGIDLQGEELNVKVLAVKPAGSANTLTEITEVVRGKQWKNRDIVYNTNGTRLKGRLEKRFEQNKLKFTSADGNFLTLPCFQIEKIQSNTLSKDTIYFKNGDRVCGTIKEIIPNKRLSLKSKKNDLYSIELADIKAINTYNEKTGYGKGVYVMPSLAYSFRNDHLYLGLKAGLLDNWGYYIQYSISLSDIYYDDSRVDENFNNGYSSYHEEKVSLLDFGVSKYLFTMGSIDFHATLGLNFNFIKCDDYYVATRTTQSSYVGSDYSYENKPDFTKKPLGLSFGVIGQYKHILASLNYSQNRYDFISLGLGYSFSIK